MTNTKDINENILKFTGKASIDTELTLGDDYKILVNGSVISSQQKDNHDGTVDAIYTVKVETIVTHTNDGKTVKTIDKRSMSRKLRGAIWHHTDGTQESYERIMAAIIGNIEDIMQKYA